ncbi:FtsX-like permease family protein [Candidatus Falkowbacteria bacterium]|jgi:cell division transport system permease protein|nr:FtsX-like permease family protein [Candidatus Falkowbacteria bacterium]MBT7007318.1 FtsX-like permease family protein [Candidatus Falkowbacteria bacterium]
MKFTFHRALKFAFQDFARNIWLSLVTITVLVLALLSVNILVSLDAISDSVVQSVEDKVDVSVFFNQDVEPETINNFTQKINNMSEVEEAIFISKEDALVSFKEKHKDDPKILEAIDEVEKNPLLDALIIRAKDVNDYNQILGVLKLEENQEIIKYQNYTDHEKIIAGVEMISNKVEKISIALTMIFVFIAILIVYNAIRVTIYTHKEEIAVMKLVGASNSFVKWPFLLEGVIYSVFSTVFAFLLLYIIFGAVGPYLSDFLEAYNFDLIKYYNSHFAFIFLSQLIGVIILNVISSAVAVGKYLRV